MSKRILIVDDTRTVIMSEKMMLAGQGYTIETAENGQIALERIQNNRPDVILLDIMMPVLNGIDTCTQIKNDPETRDIPVIMVTTKGENDMIEKAFEAGCDDYVTKPIDKLLLLSKIRNFIA